jgi:hypothetical protein
VPSDRTPWARVAGQAGTELFTNPARSSRAEPLSEAGGYADGTESRAAETHLATLRERSGDDPQAPRYVVRPLGVPVIIAETPSGQVMTRPYGVSASLR